MFEILEISHYTNYFNWIGRSLFLLLPFDLWFICPLFFFISGLAFLVQPLQVTLLLLFQLFSSFFIFFLFSVSFSIQSTLNYELNKRCGNFGLPIS